MRCAGEALQEAALSEVQGAAGALAVKGLKRVDAIAQEYSVLPVYISHWNQELLEGLAEVSGSESEPRTGRVRLPKGASALVDREVNAGRRDKSAGNWELGGTAGDVPA